MKLRDKNNNIYNKHVRMSQAMHAYACNVHDNLISKSRLCHEEHEKYCKLRKISHKACTISKGNWSSCPKVISLKVMPPESRVL